MIDLRILELFRDREKPFGEFGGMTYPSPVDRAIAIGQAIARLVTNSVILETLNSMHADPQCVRLVIGVRRREDEAADIRDMENLVRATWLGKSLEKI